MSYLEDDISPMDELLEKHFPDDQHTLDWIQNNRSEELTWEDNYDELENILSQTRLNGFDFDASSTISSDTFDSEPQSPQVLHDSHITDDELVTLPIRELNKRLRSLPKAEVQSIRKRRRSLKNRGYATSCRQRRVALKENLETQNKHLKQEIRETKAKLSNAIKDRDTYKTKYEQLRQLLVTLRYSNSS